MDDWELLVNAQSTNRDNIVTDLNNLGTLALQYYKKPTAYDGGNSSFDSWQIPESLDSTSNGTYPLSCNNQTATITGMGRELGNDGAKPIVMVALITATSIQINMVN